MGGRVGYLVGPTYLVYAAAGFSAAHFGQANYVYNKFAITGNPTGVVLPATTFNGFFVAAGAEHMLWNGLFIKGEYRFADYGTKNAQHFAPTLQFASSQARLPLPRTSIRPSRQFALS